MSWSNAALKAEVAEAVVLEAGAVVDLVSGMAVGEVREVGITVEQ